MKAMRVTNKAFLSCSCYFFCFQIVYFSFFLGQRRLEYGPIEKCPTSESIKALNILRRRALLDGACDNLQAVRL